MSRRIYLGMAESKMNLNRLGILLEGATYDGASSLSASPEYGNGSAIEFESGMFLYALVRRLAPLVVVETGTHWGFSSAFILCALADIAELTGVRGHLHTIDVSDYEGRADSLWNRLGVRGYVTPYHFDSRGNEAKELPVAPIDFLWLDADHSAESVLLEWENFGPKMNRSRGWVGFHDTRLDVREAEGIRQLLANRNAPPLSDYQLVQRVAFRNMRGLDFLYLNEFDL